MKMLRMTTPLHPLQPGMTFASARLTVIALERVSVPADGAVLPLVMGRGGRLEFERDNTHERWKPLGTADGTVARIPGALANEPVLTPPMLLFKETHTYTGGATAGVREFEYTRRTWATHPTADEFDASQPEPFATYAVALR